MQEKGEVLVVEIIYGGGVWRMGLGPRPTGGAREKYQLPIPLL